MRYVGVCRGICKVGTGICKGDRELESYSACTGQRTSCAVKMVSPSDVPGSVRKSTQFFALPCQTLGGVHIPYIHYCIRTPPLPFDMTASKLVPPVAERVSGPHTGGRCTRLSARIHEPCPLPCEAPGGGADAGLQHTVTGRCGIGFSSLVAIMGPVPDPGGGADAGLQCAVTGVVLGSPLLAQLHAFCV